MAGPGRPGRKSEGLTAQLVYMTTPENKERVTKLRHAGGYRGEAETLRAAMDIGLPLLELVHTAMGERVLGARGADARERRIETYAEEIRVQLVDQMRARHPRREPGARRAPRKAKAAPKTTTVSDSDTELATVTPISAAPAKRARKAAKKVTASPVPVEPAEA